MFELKHRVLNFLEFGRDYKSNLKLFKVVACHMHRYLCHREENIDILDSIFHSGSSLVKWNSYVYLRSDLEHFSPFCSG